MTAVGDAGAAPRRNRLAPAALVFALAAALSSWTPLAAPFGLVVGLASAVLAVRALRLPGRRKISVAALVAAIAAVAVSGTVLALTAGIGLEPAGSAVVQAPGREEVRRQLDEAAERTRAARERARGELDQLDPVQATTPAKKDGARPRR